MPRAASLRRPRAFGSLAWEDRAPLTQGRPWGAPADSNVVACRRQGFSRGVVNYPAADRKSRLGSCEWRGPWPCCGAQNLEKTLMRIENPAHYLVSTFSNRRRQILKSICSERELLRAGELRRDLRSAPRWVGAGTCAQAVALSVQAAARGAPPPARCAHASPIVVLEIRFAIRSGVLARSVVTHIEKSVKRERGSAAVSSPQSRTVRRFTRGAAPHESPT